MKLVVSKCEVKNFFFHSSPRSGILEMFQFQVGF